MRTLTWLGATWIGLHALGGVIERAAQESHAGERSAERWHRLHVYVYAGLIGVHAAAAVLHALQVPLYGVSLDFHRRAAGRHQAVADAERDAKSGV